MKPIEILKEIDSKNLNLKGSGIYMIYCTINEKCYIGRSKTIDKRWAKHNWALKYNKHTNPHLQHMYNLYGKNSLLFLAIENTEDRATREAYWALKVDSELLINMQPIGEEFPMSQAVRDKIGAYNLGRKWSEERKQKHSLAMKGRKKTGKPHSEETRKKMSQARKGKKHSLEWTEKIKASRKANSKPRKVKFDVALAKERYNEFLGRGLKKGVILERLSNEFAVCKGTIKKYIL